MGKFDNAEQSGVAAAQQPPAEGGIGNFVTGLWHKGGDMAKHLAEQAKPAAHSALEAGKDAVHKADKVATETGLKKDVTDAAVGTGNKYKNEGLGVVTDMKNGNYVHGALRASKLAATAAAGPAAVVLDAGSQVADKQAGRHLSAEQAQQVHGAIGIARKGAELSHGGVPSVNSVTGIVTEQAKKTAIDRATTAAETPGTGEKVKSMGKSAWGSVTGLFHHKEEPEANHVKK